MGTSALRFRTELIPDADTVSRSVEYPLQYTNDRDLIWGKIFEFPGGKCESLIWRKYANSDNEVHAIGAEIAIMKQVRDPERRYVGFVSGVAGTIRSIRTVRGHGFSVKHVPEEEEQRYHAHVCYEPAITDNLRPADKTELKSVLKECFSPLVPNPEEPDL